VTFDPETCYRAMETRDARFDGQFFTGVVTTGIYCRPICPARPPKRENCRFYLSSAAAQEAGFRPCLRCRPEVSPGLPAWIGASITVTRALRLIEDGALDQGSLSQLALRLGIGERHLRRLFLEHVGATPITVALNRRILFAKKLLTETGLPIQEIAFASGFNSVRRFNDAMRSVYGRPPRDLRRQDLEAQFTSGEGTITLRLAYRPPFDWTGLLRFLAARAIPGVEQVRGDVYSRSIRAGATTGRVEVQHLPELHALQARIQLSAWTDLRDIVDRLRRLFDLRANAMEIGRHLEGHPALSYSAATRVPGCWDPFELSVRAVLGQQITVAGATTLAGRIVQKYGEPAAGGSFLFPAASALRSASFEGVGLTSKRSETLRGLAAAFEDPRRSGIDLTQPLPEIERQLCSLDGIGPWTAHYVAMRAANHPDAFPSSDLALRKAAGNVSQKQLETLAEQWRPWRSYAAMQLWSNLSHAA